MARQGIPAGFCHDPTAGVAVINVSKYRKQQELRVLRQRPQLPRKALLDLPRQRGRVAQTQAASELSRRQAPGSSRSAAPALAVAFDLAEPATC
jgi:hypothetical protein